MDDPESWRWVWLAATVVGFVGEILTAGTFFLLPFAAGAAAACVTAFAGGSLALQWLLFVGLTAATTAVLRPLARRFDRDTTTEGIGARRLIGQLGLVLQDIPAGPDETGLVRVGREEWRAQSPDGRPVPAGSHVRVLDMIGTRLVVEPSTQGARG